MDTSFRIEIYRQTSELPSCWDDLAINTIFLSKSYLEITKESAPSNMCCFFIGFFEQNELIGIAIAQHISLYSLASFGERDQCIKTTIRNFVFRNLAANVLLLGNNMLTGENGWAFRSTIAIRTQFQLLAQALQKVEQFLAKEGITIHIQVAKDFYENANNQLAAKVFTSFYQFYIQPNMVFTVPNTWKQEADYVQALQKKYRDQWKRARKKAAPVQTKRFSLQDIVDYENELYALYYNVAKNAPFNTFFLNQKHFYNLKASLGHAFCLQGYFINEKLIGFCTLIKNGASIDTYFLGYDEDLQKQHLLYLNMLYDMVGFALEENAKELVLARTALEIKSSIGAKAIPMFGYIKHRHVLLNFYMKWLFTYLQPEIKWHERHPFKDNY